MMDDIVMRTLYFREQSQAAKWQRRRDLFCQKIHNLKGMYYDPDTMPELLAWMAGLMFLAAFIILVVVI